MLKRTFHYYFLAVAFFMLHSLHATNPNTVVGIVTDQNPPTINGPYALAISPNGQTLYIANTGGNTVSIVNTATNMVTGLVTDLNPATFDEPYYIAFTPNGQTAYVLNSSSYTVSIVNTATNTVTGLVTDLNPATFAEPLSMAITPDGTKGYVANGASTSVSVIDLLTNTVITSVNMGGSSDAYAIAINPAGTKVYVTRYDGTVAIINVATNTYVGNVIGAAFVFPSSIAFTPNNLFAYVSSPGSDVIGIIDAVGDGQIGQVSGPSLQYPFSLAITPDGSTMYVANNTGNSVSIVNLATNLITGTVTDLNPHTFDGPLDVVISPNGATAYVLNGSNNTVSIVYLAAPVLAPTNVKGCRLKNIFLTQTQFANIITFSPPLSGTTPVSYKIYRNAGLTNLVATVPATSPLIYADPIKLPIVNSTYYIVSVDLAGNVSTPVAVTVTQNC